MPCWAQKRLLVRPIEDGSNHKGEEDINKSTEVHGKKSDGAKQEEEAELVDLRDLNRSQRQQIVDNALATNEQSNEVLLERYAERADK